LEKIDHRVQPLARLRLTGNRQKPEWENNGNEQRT
jgi:hypothetical protein